jgi:hypothetical protein
MDEQEKLGNRIASLLLLIGDAGAPRFWVAVGTRSRS